MLRLPSQLRFEYSFRKGSCLLLLQCQTTACAYVQTKRGKRKQGEQYGESREHMRPQDQDPFTLHKFESSNQSSLTYNAFIFLHIHYTFTSFTEPITSKSYLVNMKFFDFPISSFPLNEFNPISYFHIHFSNRENTKGFTYTHSFHIQLQLNDRRFP